MLPPCLCRRQPLKFAHGETQTSCQQQDHKGSYHRQHDNVLQVCAFGWPLWLRRLCPAQTIRYQLSVRGGAFLPLLLDLVATARSPNRDWPIPQADRV